MAVLDRITWCGYRRNEEAIGCGQGRWQGADAGATTKGVAADPDACQGVATHVTTDTSQGAVADATTHASQGASADVTTHESTGAAVDKQQSAHGEHYFYFH